MPMLNHALRDTVLLKNRRNDVYAMANMMALCFSLVKAIFVDSQRIMQFVRSDDYTIMETAFRLPILLTGRSNSCRKERVSVAAPQDDKIVQLPRPVGQCASWKMMHTGKEIKFDFALLQR